LMCYHS